MANADAASDFKQGVDLLQNKNPAAAVAFFRSAVAAEELNPYYLSFLGVAVARAHKKWTAAWELCEAALRFNPNEPQFYLNLAEVYAAGRRRKDANQLLESAVKRFGPGAQTERKKRSLGKRRGQVLPFIVTPLERPLNIQSLLEPEEA